MAMSQKQKVLRQLREVGKQGLHSFWGYSHYIPRLSAVILELKKDGHDIIAVGNKKDDGCTYYLLEKKKVAITNTYSALSSQGPTKRRFVTRDNTKLAIVETCDPNYRPSQKASYRTLYESYEQTRIADVPLYTFYFRK